MVRHNDLQADLLERSRPGMSVLGYFDHIDAARQAISKGDPARGRKHFQAAIDIRPDSAEAYYGMGTACYLGKDLSAARDCFEKVRELDPSHAGAHINLGALLNLQVNMKKPSR